jgi:hypothetical protein
MLYEILKSIIENYHENILVKDIERLDKADEIKEMKIKGIKN